MKEETIIKIVYILGFTLIVIALIICFNFVYLSYNPIEIKFEIKNETLRIIDKAIERDIARAGFVNYTHCYFLNVTDYQREYLINNSYAYPVKIK